MKTGFAKVVLFGFAILVVALILAKWKAEDRSKALNQLKNTYQVTFNIFNDEVHLTASSPKITDLNKLAELIERAERMEDGTPLVPWVLDLTGNPNLKSFEGVARLQNLRSIIAVDCPKLASATGIAGMPHLSEIILSHNAVLADVSEIRDLPSLVTLDLTASPILQKLEFGDLPKLENLYLSGSRSLERLDVTARASLKQLYLDSCMLIDEIVGLENLIHLTDLDISNCQKLKHLKGVEKLAELIVLDMRNVELADFSVIGNLPKLEVLRLAGQGSLTNLEPFSKLQTLREFHLESCPNIQSLQGIPPTVSEYLGVIRCDKLVSLAGLEVATELQHVDLNSCTALEDIEALKSVTGLIRLSLLHCPKIKNVQQLEHNRNLAFVRLGDTGVIAADVEPLQELLPDTVFDFSIPE